MTPEKRNEMICKLREERGWFYHKLAERYGLSKARISQILAAGRKAKPKRKRAA